MFLNRHRKIVLIKGFVCLLLSVAETPLVQANDDIQFNRDVRPILSENCFLCHGPDKNNRKAKLRLDVREVALDSKAFIPGKPAESELVSRIYNTNQDDVMPPPKSQKKLTDSQKEVLKKWIANGAQYEPHWAYIPPKRFPPPKVRNARWVQNPIDAFILKSLEAKGIQPSPQADKRTLLRRLSLDLIGLPPSPKELNDFLADSSFSAYERQVDRLLESEHFGERMAVPWLDLVRYADTAGYHGDNNLNVFPYRDYVINSFNDDKPFDRFTIEQIAGDLLPNPTTEDRIATAFNRLNMVTREGGAQPKEYLAKYAADRVRTVSMTWLGSTMGCCECHDHKFDPFSTRDFYGMEAFFADIKQWGIYSDYAYTPNPDLRGFRNDHPFPPEIEVNSPYLMNRIEQIRVEMRDTKKNFALGIQNDPEQRSAFDSWLKSARGFVTKWPDGWSAPLPEVSLKMKDTNCLPETNVTVSADSVIQFTNKPREDTRITLPLQDDWIAAIRLEIVPQADDSEKPRQKKGTSLALTAKFMSGTNESKISFQRAEADHAEKTYSMGLPVIDVKAMWKIPPGDAKQWAVWLLENPIHAQPGERLVLDLGNASLESVRSLNFSLCGAGTAQIRCERRTARRSPKIQIKPPFARGQFANGHLSERRGA